MRSRLFLGALFCCLAIPAEAQYIAARDVTNKPTGFMVNGDWAQIPGEIKGAPDMCSPDGGATAYMAMRGTEDDVWIMEYRAGVWSRGRSIGGEIESSPTIACPGGGAAHVFVRGKEDNGLWRNIVNGSAQSGWVPLGGEFKDDPDALAWNDDAIIVVVRGVRDEVWSYEIRGTSQTPTLSNLGGNVTSSPSIAGPRLTGGGRTVTDSIIFARGPANGLVWGRYAGHGAAVWQREDTTGRIAGAPDAAYDPSRGLFHVAIRGTDNQIYYGSLSGSRFSGWTPRDGEVASDPTIIDMSGSSNASETAPAGHYRIEITGFRANRQTIDDALNRDGWADEVYLAPYVVTFSRQRAPVLLPRQISPVMGQRQGRVTVAAGRATDSGGIATGHPHPDDPTAGPMPGTWSLLFEGELRSGEDGVAVLPGIWEWDDNAAGLRDFDVSFNAYLSHAANGLRARLRETIGERTNIRVTATALQLGAGDWSVLGWDGSPRDYPIGVLKTPATSLVHYRPRLMVITYEVAEMIATGALEESASGAPAAMPATPPGVFAMRFRDNAPGFAGDYTVFVRVTRIR